MFKDELFIKVWNDFLIIYFWHHMNAAQLLDQYSNTYNSNYGILVETIVTMVKKKKIL